MRQIEVHVGFVLLLGFVLFLHAAAVPNEPQNAGAESGHLDTVELQRKAESALARVQQNDVGEGIVDATSYIELAAHVDPRRAIPALEAYFARSHESDLRNEIASVLVSLGDEDPQYWNLILRQAESALSEDSPDPFGGEEGGGPVSTCSSEALLNWAKNRNLTSDEACKEATRGIAEKFLPLADSGDRRAVPVLQKALKARNSLMQVMGSRGLVLIGHRDAITLVIEAIERAPQHQARVLADGLIESDDPRAESVVRQYMPDINFPEARQFHNFERKTPNGGVLFSRASKSTSGWVVGNSKKDNDWAIGEHRDITR